MSPRVVAALVLSIALPAPNAAGATDAPVRSGAPRISLGVSAALEIEPDADLSPRPAVLLAVQIEPLDWFRVRIEAAVHPNADASPGFMAGSLVGFRMTPPGAFRGQRTGRSRVSSGAPGAR